MAGVNMLADIGNGTMNIMYINSKKPVESKCWTEKLGVNQCVITEYFDNREREDRIIGRITAAVEKCLSGLSFSPSAEVKSADETVSNEIDFDFLGG